MKKGLSVVLATHNEEANIEATLQSVATLADEIVIVDGKSTDKTVAIAKKYNARVISAPNDPMFHRNKQIATDNASYEWILELDADEIIPPLLSQEIAQVVAGTHNGQVMEKNPLFARHTTAVAARDGITYSTHSPINGYFIARKNFFLGGYLMHSGVYPDGVIRLVRSGKAFWPCKSVHEQMQLEGGVGWLQQPMIHMADPTFTRYLQRANRYTTATAKDLFDKNVHLSLRFTVYYMMYMPLKTFCLLFFRHKGVLDGLSGFVWSLMSGLHWPMAYLKLIEYYKKS